MEIDFRNVNVVVVARRTDWFFEINFPPKRVSREPFEREFSTIRSRFGKNSIFDVPLSETLVRRDVCPDAVPSVLPGSDNIFVNVIGMLVVGLN